MKNINIFNKRVVQYKEHAVINFLAITGYIALLIDPTLHRLIVKPSGYISASLLLCVLLLNPLCSAFPKAVFLKKLNRFRRHLGISMAVYGALHVMTFYVKRAGFVDFIKYIIHPALLPGFIAALICIPLAFTSNNSSVKKMGFMKWKKLHKKVYIVQWLSFVHIWMLGDIGKWCAAIGMAILVIFQLMRRRKNKNKQMNTKIALSPQAS